MCKLPKAVWEDVGPTYSNWCGNFDLLFRIQMILQYINHLNVYCSAHTHTVCNTEKIYSISSNTFMCKF